MSLWTRNGKLIINSSGKLIECDHCPCGGESSSESSISSDSSFDTSCPRLSVTRYDVDATADCNWVQSSAIVYAVLLSPPYDVYVPENGCAYDIREVSEAAPARYWTRNTVVLVPEGSQWRIDSQHPAAIGSDEVYFSLPPCDPLNLFSALIITIS